MLAVALVFAGLAAAVHVYIFVLESVRWEAPETRAIFGTDAQTAAVTRPLAFNQGFYNLFLAVGAAAGIVATGWSREVGHRTGGARRRQHAGRGARAAGQ